MKKPFIRYIFISIILLACASAANAEDYKFPPDLIELIEKYGGTEKPVLPNPRKVKEEADRFSYPPARLHLPVNVIVDKRRTTVFVVNVFGDTLDRYRCCASARKGQKKEEDDMRTPEGTFKVAGVYNSADWRYKKVGEKCYGPYFVSIVTPGFYGIGIHGTNAPYSVPGRSSHGCIRLRDENIVKLRKWVNRNTMVTILPDDVDDAKKEEKKIKAAYVGPGQKVVPTSEAKAESARRKRLEAAGELSE